jgi:hypothetical protein
MGSIIGAVILTALPELLREVQAMQEIGYGALLILFVLFAPRGVAGMLQSIGWMPREALVRGMKRPATLDARGTDRAASREAAKDGS